MLYGNTLNSWSSVSNGLLVIFNSNFPPIFLLAHLHGMTSAVHFRSGNASITLEDDEMTGMCVRVVKFSRPREFSIDSSHAHKPQPIEIIFNYLFVNSCVQKADVIHNSVCVFLSFLCESLDLNNAMLLLFLHTLVVVFSLFFLASAVCYSCSLAIVSVSNGCLFLGAIIWENFPRCIHRLLDHFAWPRWYEFTQNTLERCKGNKKYFLLFLFFPYDSICIVFTWKSISRPMPYGIAFLFDLMKYEK